MRDEGVGLYPNCRPGLTMEEASDEEDGMASLSSILVTKDEGSSPPIPSPRGRMEVTSASPKMSMSSYDWTEGGRCEGMRASVSA